VGGGLVFSRAWPAFFRMTRRFTGYLLNHLDNDKISEVKAVSGSCMLIRREVTEQIGYLDERYFAYQEDTDYCVHARVRQAGRCILCQLPK
jgi:GT2 family glycosyltransferase